ncbi:MAG: DUF4276 family protein [Nodularia sp. CChRGM 3473]
MEAWFIADIDTLQEFYGEGFREDRIYQGMRLYSSVEQVSKATLKIWLETATRHTDRGKYDKRYHAPRLLELLDVAKVRQASPYCDRLFTTLTEKITKL